MFNIFGTILAKVKLILAFIALSTVPALLLYAVYDAHHNWYEVLRVTPIALGVGTCITVILGWASITLYKWCK